MNPNTDGQSAPRCFLCRHPGASIIDSLRVKDLVVAWRQMGVQFSPEAWAVFEGTLSVCLFQCKQCGFLFFDPALVGNAAFYAELQNQLQTYYPPISPGFERAVRLARHKRLQSVLDIGCGCGSFLDLAKQNGLATAGMELNPPAIESSRRKGHSIYTCGLADLEREIGRRRFDLITIFEVLEHVSDPVQLLSDAAGWLSPSGYLAVTVPNRNGVHRLFEMDPHQWPPHHLSRWRRRDLKELGRRCRLEVVSTGGDLLLGGQIEHFSGMQKGILFALGKRRDAKRSNLLRLLVLGYRKTGCKFFVPRWGASVYAFYRKRVPRS
jgi:SAM-dependent methyltransferase